MTSAAISLYPWVSQQMRLMVTCWITRLADMADMADMAEAIKGRLMVYGLVQCKEATDEADPFFEAFGQAVSYTQTTSTTNKHRTLQWTILTLGNRSQPACMLSGSDMAE